MGATELPRYQFTDSEAAMLVQSILQAIREINSVGVYLPTGLDMRFFIDYISHKVKVVSFFGQIVPNAMRKDRGPQLGIGSVSADIAARYPKL
jgi:hypothetical protein